ncbi:metallophosphoesterase family protein [Paraburkholderia nemoris]|uniref:metallophosphoesterase family protein n=1 Tax=Paraburkholderia nemoris TaxID=2793076 RepID=UPI001B1C0EAC|nr:metallophosphoesterase [Paraburkholderia nemoris]CAE6732642.1 hypothetical protein R75777_02141 [Paraburkholderia nemoris]
MPAVFSILHISDLHRSPSDNITNAELISALVSDRQRYLQERPSIRAPDAIIVSGDIIQGVPLNTPDAVTRLDEQYATAFAFIEELADRFVGGDHSRVILVPGNHDIDWVMSRAAMELVPTDQVPENLLAELYRADTPYRWDWKKRELLRISDNSLYAKRLEAYWRFFTQFYSGVSGLLRVCRDQSANLYSLWDGRIGIAAFNSCHGNDCFAFHGSIPREVVARAHLDLMDEGGFGLLIAVWHHNVEGPPYRTDYMDVDIVRGMIGRGFRLGLYGHQHRAEAVPIQIHLADRETMAVVSAGSLCAGSRELPTGAHRGYNIIEIAGDLQSARVHVREMSVSNLFCASRRAAFGGASYVDLKWDPPADLAGRPIDSSLQRLMATVAQAEIELKAGAPSTAKELLLPVAAELPDFGRLLLIESARQTNDRFLVIELLTPPRTIGELVERTDTFIRVKDYAEARAGLDQFGEVLGVAEPHVKELRARIASAEAMAS